MIAIPAIDIMDGQCVRLIRGDYLKKNTYGTDPSAVAAAWESKGAELIHVVDLDGARAGHPVNVHAISSILRTVSVQIEVGGGIRSFETAARLLRDGVSRIVLGTAAVAEPDLVKRLIDSFSPDRVIVGIDARRGQVATSGWMETHTVKAADLAKTKVSGSHGGDLHRHRQRRNDVGPECGNHPRARSPVRTKGDSLGRRVECR